MWKTPFEVGEVISLGESRRMKTMRSDIGHLSSIMVKVFSIALGLICVAALGVVGLYVSGEIFPEKVVMGSASNALSVVGALFTLLLSGVATGILRSVFRDMANGRSPFTIEHSRSIRMLGVLFLAGVALNFIIPPLMMSSFIGEVEISYGVTHPISSYPTFAVDLKGIIGAVVCFALSVIWRYGALLQEESDESF